LPCLPGYCCGSRDARIRRRDSWCGFGALLAVAGLPFLPSVAKSFAGSASGSFGDRSAGILGGGDFFRLDIDCGVGNDAYRRWTLEVAITAEEFSPPGGIDEFVAGEPYSSISTPAIQAVVPLSFGGRGIVVRSRGIAVPTAVGFFRPVILIPDWGVQELSVREVRPAA